MKGKERYKYLDIMRIIFCIAVLLYHLNILKGGYLAVSCFFVLSAYLSGISNFKKEHFSLTQYYRNRLVKIYCPLLFVVFVTTALVLLFTDFNWLNLKPEINSILGGFNNIWQLNNNADYFARNINSPFMHLWYIAILLQFDFIFPFIFLGLRKIGDKFHKTLPCIITLLLSCVSAVYFYQLAINNNTMTAYYTTTARVFSLLLGLSLAFIHHYYGKPIPKRLQRKPYNKIYFVLYLTLLLILFKTVDYTSVFFASSMILVSLITMRLIDYATVIKKEKGMFNKIITKLADVSYEIYLWQYPIIFLFQYINISQYMKIILIVSSTMIIAHLVHFILTNKEYQFPKYLLKFNMICIALFGVYQFIIAKDYTLELQAIEKELQQNELLMKKRLEEYALIYNKDKEILNNTLANLDNYEQNLKENIYKLPIVGIGDSVMLGAVPTLYKSFPNGYFDGQVSRTPWVANDILTTLKQADKLGNPIVIHLGTNGDCSYECRKEIMATCGDRKVFWVNVSRGNDPLFNEKLNKFAQEYDNLYIIDWQSVALKHPEYLYADGIHLNDIGKEHYIKTIYDALYKVYLDEIRAKKEEVIMASKEDKTNNITFYGNEILLNSFRYIEDEIDKTNFVIDASLDFDYVKNDIIKAIDEERISKKIVLVFDENFVLNQEQYEELLKLVPNSQIYILFTKENNLNIIEDNVEIINFYQELKKNDAYLKIDKTHLTEAGNKALTNILCNVLKVK